MRFSSAKCVCGKKWRRAEAYFSSSETWRASWKKAPENQLRRNVRSKLEGYAEEAVRFSETDNGDNRSIELQ